MNAQQNPSAPHQVIFVPGFYGTQLLDKDGKEVWINASQALFGSKTLAMNSPEALNIDGSQELKAGHVKGYVKVLGGLFNQNVYGDTINAIQDKLGEQYNIVPLAYDWRQENYVTVKLLDKKVKQLQKKNPKSISIIAHSMGGLAVAYYLRYGVQPPDQAKETWAGAQHVDNVVIGATPFRGTLVVFHNMQHGVKFGLNTELMKAETFSSIHSTYELLPRYESPTEFENWVLNMDKWKQHKWGLLKNPSKSRENYLKLRLQRSNQFMGLIHAKNSKSSPYPFSFLLAYSKGHKTVDGAKLVDGKIEWEFGDGDQTVATRSAQLPSGFKQGITGAIEISSSLGHQDTLADPKVLSGIQKMFSSSAQKLTKN